MPDLSFGNIRILNRPDFLDAEILSEAERGRFWEMVDQKLTEMIAAQQQVLETATVDRTIAYTQGYIAAVRRMKEIPKILRKEADAEKQKR